MSSENPYQAPQSDIGFGTDDYPVPRSRTSILLLFFSFAGRIPRRVFWAASLALAFVFYAVVFIAVIAFGEESAITNSVIFVAYIPMIWSSLAIQTKRWHDRDKSGRWILVSFLPLIGPIWAFVETGCLRGTEGPNSYGPDPT
ncbi:MAG: DUF805 domain-containing protein [Planctomycetia bacterium]|nr:DUF805 domain-containing protein [Planctomycetia bacterium]